MSEHDYRLGDSEPVVREETTRMTDPEAASLCVVFADGLESGMGYTRIIDMLERQDVDGKIVDRLRRALHEDGNRLGEAFARFGLLDATARKLIMVAEKQGTLPSTFTDLSTHYSKRHDRRKKFIAGLVEPCILIALGLLVARNIITGDFQSFVETMDVAAFLKPILKQAAMEVGLFGAVTVSLAYIYLNLPVETPMRSLTHRLWLRLPLGVINKSARLHSIALFFRYTEQSLSSGLTVHQSLALAAEASNNPKLEERIGRAREAIEEGETLAEALKIARALPRDAIDFIDVGEESGQLDERLHELADKYEKRADESFKAKRTVILYVLRFIIIVAVVLMLLLSIIQILSETFGDIVGGTESPL